MADAWFLRCRRAGLGDSIDLASLISLGADDDFEIYFKVAYDNDGFDGINLLVATASFNNITINSSRFALRLSGTDSLIQPIHGVNWSDINEYEIIRTGNFLSFKVNGSFFAQDIDITGFVGNEYKAICNSSDGVSSSGRYNLYRQRIKKNGVVVHDYNPALSGGTGNVLTDSVSGNNGTLVNFPTNNSQWVLYDDGTGGGEVTVNSLAQPFTESISATVTAAQVTETSISSTAQAFTESNVINVSANITSSISATALAFTASISATVTAPGVNDSSINSFAQAFTESNNVTVFSNLSANIQSQAQAFTESINAVRLIGIDTSISAAAPAFIESLLIQTPTLWTDRAQPINNWQDQTQPSNNWQDRG